jgi:hypothetical protein
MALLPNYYLKFSDPSRDPIIIAPGQTNNDTTLTLFGRNTTDWGVHLNENLVKLLENYCNDYPPGYDNQVAIGQFWYNSATNELNLCISNDPLIWHVIGNRRLDVPDNILLKSDIPSHLTNYIPLSGNSDPTSGSIYVKDILFEDKKSDLKAVNKNYVDELVCVCGIYNVDATKYIKLSGDTITANITVPSIYDDPLYAVTPEYINNYTRTKVYTKKLSLTSVTDYNYTEIDRRYDTLNGDSSILGGYDGAIVYISGIVNLERGKQGTKISIPDIDEIYYAMTSGHNFDNAESTLDNSDNACGTSIPTSPCNTCHTIESSNSLSLYRGDATNAAEIQFMVCGLAKGIKCRSCLANKSYDYILSCGKAKNAGKFPLNKTESLPATNQIMTGVSWTLPTTEEDIPANSVITVTVNGVDYVEGVDPELTVTGSTWALTFADGKQLPKGEYEVITSRSIIQGPLPNDCYSTVKVYDAVSSSAKGLWYDIGVYNNRRYFVLNKKDGEKSLIWSSLENITSAIGKYDGLYNSNTVLSQTKNPGVEYPAINFCKSVTVGGFNDWYLPASDELDYMFKSNDNIPSKDRLDEALTYWTSTEKDKSLAISLDFTSGVSSPMSKGAKNLARAIRSVSEPVTAGSKTTNTLPSTPTTTPVATPSLPTTIDENMTGGKGVTEKEYTVGKGGGDFVVDYDMYKAADAMYIYVNGKLSVHTSDPKTGKDPVSGAGSLTVPKKDIPDNAVIKIKMSSDQNGTYWTYKIRYSNGIQSNASSTPPDDIGGTKLADAPNASFVISDIDGSFYGTYDECTTFIKKLNSDKFRTHNDWVIPKKSDLMVISNHRDDVSIAGTLTSYYKYWSCKSSSAGSFDAMNLYDQKWVSTLKTDKCMVRAIRYA